MYERIVVALDGSEVAERVLTYVEPLAEKFGAAVSLVRATAPLESGPAAQVAMESGGTIDPVPLVEAERREAAEYLERVVDRLRARGLSVTAAQPEGAAAESIVEHARGARADLIAMTTHGRSGLGRLVLGSVADAVMRNAACPVLLVRVSEETRGWPGIG